MEKHIFSAPSTIEAINEAKKKLVETEKNLLITELKTDDKEVTIRVIEIREILKFIENFLKQILKNIGYNSIDIEITSKEQIPLFTIFSDNDALLIGKNGKNLEALQLIIYQAIKKELDTNFKFIITVGNYKEKREISLVRLAKNVAEEVKKTKIDAKLDSMNSYERRIIHNTLKNNKFVYTESVGEEPNRAIVIKSRED